MHLSVRFAALGIAAAMLAACGGTANNAIPGTALQSSASRGDLSPARRGLWPRPGPAQRACEAVSAGFARCLSWVRTDVHSATTPNGYFPSDLRTAYGLSAASANDGVGDTVAIVDAYDDPNAESDLNVYRSQFGMSPCTTANGCFSKVKFARRTNTGWGEEESLDVDMVSAICPNCHITLVEASSAANSALVKAENYATAHAGYVSNSWSGNEGSTSDDGSFAVAGVEITAATGDSGYNNTAQWPAILPSVTAVGGTHLASVSPRDESAWSGAGSGCSTVYATPPYQASLNTGCSMRAQSDVSAVADPNTGVAVYDTFHAHGWMIFGGTSVATPIVASVYALAGNASTDGNTYLYAHASDLYDVSAGNNGNCGAPLCTAGAGWDGPTGLGSPNGLSAF